MKSSTFPQWKGFEFSPKGCLLEQFVDLSAAIGFAYERSCDFYKDYHTHDRLMLVFPRGSSSMAVNTRAPRKKYMVESGSVLVVPKDLDHDDEGTSTIYDTLALYPTAEQIRLAGEKLGLTPDEISRFQRECLRVRRSKKLDRLVQEYFFERVLHKRSNEDTDYLARKILCDTMTAAFPRLKGKAGEDLPEVSEPVLERAIKFIEANLFEDFETSELAKRIGVSASTLLRKFRGELELTPYAYIRKRRLEEAHRLLQSGEYPVGDVALLVGYESFGAFSDAFKAEYGRSPSQLRGKG